MPMKHGLNLNPRAARAGASKRSFTLTELLVAIGIIVIIAGVTAIGVQRIAREARISSATNSVIAALDNARAYAIRDNRLTALVFRPRQEGSAVFIELVIVQQPTFGGDVYQVDGVLLERFTPRPETSVRRLPNGIKVAGPFLGSFGENLEDVWVTQSHFPNINPETGDGEQSGQLLAVMFAGDGTVVTRNAVLDGNLAFADFNNNGLLDYGGAEYAILNGNAPSAFSSGAGSFQQLREDDESTLAFVTYVAVYDDDAARAAGDPSEWTAVGNHGQLGPDDGYYDDLVAPLPNNPDEPGAPLAYISRNADRIHFNRYTGVVMR